MRAVLRSISMRYGFESGWNFDHFEPIFSD